MVHTGQTLALFGTIGWQELLIIGVIMLVLFGRRLPEVGRSLGQGIVQFKKGLRDIEDEVERGAREGDRREERSGYNRDAYDRSGPKPLTEGEDRRVSQGTMSSEPAESRPPTGA
ncbi:MAG: twin-arginine translocase TatA/TatE family subunit [Phycisphaerales bacterium]